MRIVKRVLSTYSADNFGVCSALYELGGLVVMHDASGCNSTYNTHDEPRWYDMDSMVFISGLTEKDAIFGNDEVLIRNLCSAAEKLKPKFVCVCGGPLPHIIGTDFRAVAKAVTRRTGLPTFGIQTNGMDAYTSGAGEAYACLVDLMNEPLRTNHKECTTNGAEGDVSETLTADSSDKRRANVDGSDKRSANSDSFDKNGTHAESLDNCGINDGRTGRKIKVNILGTTPLDFSLNGSVQAMQELLSENGFEVRSTWAMGDTLENILSSSDADVNLVVSATGFAAAKRMKERFGIPYVIGCPVGNAAAGRIFAELRSEVSTERTVGKRIKTSKKILLIGEPVMTKSIAESIDGDVSIICPLRGVPQEIADGTREVVLEDELREACREAERVIADPLYARLLPEEPDKFVELPHVAYSGRYYEKEIPVLVGTRLDAWLERQDI